jgi:hypothetical protein
LISYSSVDSFIKRDYVLDILDEYKVNRSILERLRLRNDADVNIFDWKSDTKSLSMSKDKGPLVQHRREYYNDFEDCLRDYKNAKIKSIQKHTKVHLSDGDNGESDSEYVDCCDSNELKSQLSAKSMPHVPSAGQPVRQKCEKAEAPKAQLNDNDSRHEPEASTQLPSHNNNHNQIIDVSSRRSSANIKNPLAISVDKVSPAARKSISSDDKILVPDDTKLRVNRNSADKQSKAVGSPVQIALEQRETSTKRKSCKKKLDGVVKDPTQR